MILFFLSNILSILIIVISTLSLLIIKFRKVKYSTIVWVCPEYDVQLKNANISFWSGTLFLIMSWILCLGEIIDAGKESNYIGNCFMIFAFVWACLEIFLLISQTILHFMKTTKESTFNVSSGIKSTAIHSILYFILAFFLK